MKVWVVTESTWDYTRVTSVWDTEDQARAEEGAATRNANGSYDYDVEEFTINQGVDQ